MATAGVMLFKGPQARRYTKKVDFRPADSAGRRSGRTSGHFFGQNKGGVMD